MLQRSYLRQNAAAVAKPACKPAKRSRLVPCASVQRDVSAGVASVTSAPTADSSTSTATQTRQEPYRVTETTIEDIKSYHKSQIREYDYVVDDSWVEGSIPAELVGTYMRNGPGMQTAGRHTFDGDGQIVVFSFDGSGKVRFTNKFVRTRGFLDEQVAGRPVHRTAFTKGAADGSLLFNPFDMQMKNVANTGVLHWGNKLLALYESNMPYELDASTLNTFGECDMNGQLDSAVLAAHFRVMPGRQQLQQQQQQQQQVTPLAQAPDGRTLVGFSFNTSFGSGGADMIFYEFAEDGRLRHAPQHYALPGVVIALIHDVVVTNDYYVIVVGPIDFSMSKFVTQYMTSRCSIAECMEYKPQEKPTTVHLVPRPGGKAAGMRPYVIETPAMFVFHHANAFQVPSGNSSSSSSSSSGKELLVLDTVGWADINFENSQHNLNTSYYKGGNRPELQRMVFELDPPQPQHTNTRSPSSPNTGRCISRKRLDTHTMEFPSVNWDWHGQQHSHIYACADTVGDDLHWGPTQSVLKISCDTAPVQDRDAILNPSLTNQQWDAGTRRLVNEPLFVPKPNATAEDEGWVLATMHNAASGKGELVILDAQHIAEGPVATVRLPHHLPAGLHGSFSPQLLLKGWEEAAARNWQDANAVHAI